LLGLSFPLASGRYWGSARLAGRLGEVEGSWLLGGLLGLGVVEMLYFGGRIESCVSDHFGRLGLRQQHSQVAGLLSSEAALVGQLGQLALCLFRPGHLGGPVPLCPGTGLHLPGPRSRYLVYGDGGSLEIRLNHPAGPH
jgi:hypothetical protein